MNNVKIFVVHYTKLKDRKSFMLEQKRKWILENLEFYEEYDKELLSLPDINDAVDNDIMLYKHGRTMSLGEISLILKNKNLIHKIVEEYKEEYFLILEDDVIFKEDPKQYIQELLSYCKNNSIYFDAIFLGEGGLRVGDDIDCFYRKDNPSTNGLCTVLYSRECIIKINDYFTKNKISEPLDFEFNNLFRDEDYHIYWGKAITKHGSVLAQKDDNMIKFKSSLR